MKAIDHATEDDFVLVEGQMRRNCTRLRKQLHKIQSRSEVLEKDVAQLHADNSQLRADNMQLQDQCNSQHRAWVETTTECMLLKSYNNELQETNNKLKHAMSLHDSHLEMIKTAMLAMLADQLRHYLKGFYMKLDATTLSLSAVLRDGYAAKTIAKMCMFHFPDMSMEDVFRFAIDNDSDLLVEDDAIRKSS